MTQFYVGTKVIEAWPEEKGGKPGYAVKYKGGYISWSPKDVFEEAYKPLDDMMPGPYPGNTTGCGPTEAGKPTGSGGASQPE